MSGTGFTPQQKADILFRDGWKCAMCGRRATEANHRANRGHGGFLGANTLDNGAAICHECNGAIEDDGPLAELARQRGVKISRYDKPNEVRYMSPLFGMWVMLEGASSRLAVEDEGMNEAMREAA